jgi:hypothetical protein
MPQVLATYTFHYDRVQLYSYKRGSLYRSKVQGGVEVWLYPFVTLSFDPRTVQPVAIRYGGYAIPAHSTAQSHPSTCRGTYRGRVEVQFYSSLTSALEVGARPTPRPSHFSPGKRTRHWLHRTLRGPRGRSGQVRKISAPPGFELGTFQPVLGRYIDYAIQAPIYY